MGLGIGLFTPTPAAAMGVLVILLYGFIARFFSQTHLTAQKLRNSVLSTAKTAGMIYLILFAADVLKGFFARSGLPVALTNLVANSSFDPYLILVLMLILLIILGCFMESLSMILVVVPFFWPTLIELNGGDYVAAADAAFGMTSEQLKIWFGILALVVVELGLITPPVGLNVFVIKSFAPDTSMSTIFGGVMPFFAVEVFRVASILLFPALCLFLPAYLSG
jgi:TRAP-type C4-dicarboxylate transport system permease large subunit